MKHWQWVGVNFKLFKTEAVNQITLIPLSSVQQPLNCFRFDLFCALKSIHIQKSKNYKTFDIVLILIVAVFVVLRF